MHVPIPAPTAPRQQFGLLRRLVPKSMQPLVRGVRKRFDRLRRHLDEPFHTVYPYTAVSARRQQNLLRLAAIVEEERIPGAVVECGVLDGGAAALLSWGTRGSGRPVHLFDAWEGLPPATPHDGEASEKWSGGFVGSPVRVRRVMEKLEVDPRRLHFHVGWFEETFPAADIPQIALLHADADFYAPTKLILDRWFPHVAPGGFVQFDDYSTFEGCWRAVNEFLAAHPELELQRFGEEGTAWFVRVPPAGARGGQASVGPA